MFTLTPQARAVVRRVTGHKTLSTTSGLRIATMGGDSARMRVAASAGPQPHDSVVERDGARVFLGPGTAERLRGRILHAVTERTGRVRFVLRARP